MKAYVVEEAYEVVEAIEGGDPGKLREELGDLLFQVVFQAQLGKERGEFDMEGVEGSICEKMLRRHPHVFDADRADSVDDANELWEQRKSAERPGRRLLDDVPRALPALHRARRMTERAAGVGFDWPDVAGVWAKADEELAELREAAAGGDPEAVRHELGDVLFALVNLSRFLCVDPEDALQRATQRFRRRFGHIEDALRAQGRRIEDSDLAEMDRLWNEAKAQESGHAGDPRA